MNHKKLVAFIFFIFLCFSGTSAWAQEEMYPENGYAENYAEGYVDENYAENYADSYPEYYADSYPENYADSYPENYADSYPENYAESYPDENNEALENELLLNGNKSWQQGFDVRLHLGMGGVLVNFNDEERSVEGMVVGYIAGDIGYRWKNGGIYLKLGYYPFDGSKIFNPEGERISMNFTDTSLLGKFYIPLVDDWELVIDAGIGLFSSYFFDLQTGLGANWHLWDMTLGFEVIYQYAILVFGQLGLHLVQASFVIGYTF